jgi:hypothetical protein
MNKVLIFHLITLIGMEIAHCAVFNDRVKVMIVVCNFCRELSDNCNEKLLFSSI